MSWRNSTVMMIGPRSSASDPNFHGDECTRRNYYGAGKEEKALDNGNAGALFCPGVSLLETASPTWSPGSLSTIDGWHGRVEGCPGPSLLYDEGEKPECSPMRYVSSIRDLVRHGLCDMHDASGSLVTLPCSGLGVLVIDRPRRTSRRTIDSC